MKLSESRQKTFMIFLFFIKLGFFTFGGGWSLFAQIQEEFVEKRGWLSDEELLDINSVARSIPGVMIVNTSVLFGYHVGGTAAAFAAGIGISLPSVIVLSVVTVFYEVIKDNVYATRILVGIRAAIVPIIVSASLKLRKSAFKESFGYAIAAVAVLLCLFTEINRVLIIVLGALAGLSITEVKRHHAA